MEAVAGSLEAWRTISTTCSGYYWFMPVWMRDEVPESAARAGLRDQTTRRSGRWLTRHTFSFQPQADSPTSNFLI